MTTPSSEGFSTTDLSLATYLIYLGHEPELFNKEKLKSGYPIGGWKFNSDLQRVQQAVVEYHEEKKTPISAKELLRLMSKSRSELYNFLGIKKGNS